MVELRLPKNSRVMEGITWEKPSDAENVQEVRIYRYTPEDSKNPVPIAKNRFGVVYAVVSRIVVEWRVHLLLHSSEYLDIAVTKDKQ